MNHLPSAFLLPIAMLMVGCASNQPVTSDEGWVTHYEGGGPTRPAIEKKVSPAEKKATKARKKVDQDFERAAANQRLFTQIYEDAKSVLRYCGEPTEDDAWGAECNGKLLQIHWARMQRVYQLVDYSDVQHECIAYPEKCDVAKNLEALVLARQQKAAEQRRDAQYAAIEAEQEWDEGQWARDLQLGLEVAAEVFRSAGAPPDRVCEVKPTPEGGYTQKCFDR